MADYACVAQYYVYGMNATKSTARSTSSGNIAGLLIGAHYNSGGPAYYFYRSYLKFDTMTIPSSATITQVNLTMTVIYDDSDTDFDVQIVKQDWSGQDPITSGNRETAYDNCLSGTADSSIWRNTSGMSIDTPYTSGNLSTDWINKGGYTYYSLRSSRDYSNTTGSGLERVQIRNYNDATVAYRPTLTILGTGLTAATARYRGLLGVGV